MSTTTPTRPSPISRFNWPVVFLLLGALYSVTAAWTVSEQNVDTIATTLPAWHVLAEGSLDLSEYAGLNPWIVETPDGYWTNRPPGLILTAAVGQALALPFSRSFTPIPGTATAVLLAAGAVALVGIEVSRLFGTRTAYVSVIALGLASATWPQASSELFPHAVGQFLMALVIRAVARDNLWLCGTVLGAAVTVRPPLAVVALVLGLGLGVSKRSLVPVIQIGVPSTIGLATLIAYNRLAFGTVSLSGGYDQFVENGAQYRTPSGYLSNLTGTFFDGSNGLFVWSPWIAITLVHLFAKRQKIDPPWIGTIAVAGLMYLLVHTGLNRFWGGLAFNYRYPLEPLILAMPLLALGLRAVLDRRLWRMSFITALGVSIALQAAVAFFLTCVDDGGVATCSLL